jgi:4-hydroxy-2-oxoheptanedioate aldolase
VGPDWDWIWVDGQHGQMGYADILAAVRACNLVRRPAVVRVPGHEAGMIGLALDTAAEGVMVPMVDTVEQARQIVRAAKFPPFGSRSYGGRRPIDLYGRTYAHADQPQPLLICQIETLEGLKNSARIAAVKGVDAIFFGPDDTALRKGLPMDQPRPAGYFDKALKTVARAAADHGKIAGGVFTTPEALNQAAEIGFRLIVACGDVGLLAAGSKSASKSLRSALTELELSNTEKSGKEKSLY